MLWALLIAVIAVALWAMMTYNSLVALNQRTGQAFADIDVQLKQRQSLIPNLVETVKGYAAHEKSTFDEVIRARNAAMGAAAPDQKAAAEAQLTGALGRLVALGESYPDLKANTTFIELQQQLSAVEDKIAAARRFFNNAVSEFNAAIQAFPGLLIARQMGFQAKTFFDLGTERAVAEATPQVKF